MRAAAFATDPCPLRRRALLPLSRRAATYPASPANTAYLLPYPCADLGLLRYKIMVHVTVGENKGEGVRVGTRCLWDPACDNMASHTVVNDTLFAVCTAYGAYLY